MFYLWITLGIVAALVALPLAIGMILPQRYTGEVKATFPNPPAEVWAALVDFEKHPMTGRMMKSVEKLPVEDGLPTWIEEMSHGEKISVKTVESEQPVHLVRQMSSAALPISALWEYDLQAFKNDGCQVRLRSETYIRQGNWMVPLFRFMTVVGGGVRKGLQIHLDMVAETLRADSRNAAT